MRKEFTTKTKVLAFKRSNGKCERCQVKLFTGKYEYHHDNPDGLTGEPTLENCVVLCKGCHREQTNTDVKTIARAKRVEARHLGARKSRTPMPFGRSSKWKKKINGQVVLR